MGPSTLSKAITPTTFLRGSSGQFRIDAHALELALRTGMKQSFAVLCQVAISSFPLVRISILGFLQLAEIMNIIVSVSLFVLLNSVITSEAGTLRYKLELLQVLFRHGDRVPAKEEVYKTDPYDPEFYEAYGGYGQLTKLGMLREYQIGQMLRNVYNTFLGDYKPDEVYGFSTNVDRTKASLQLALAGLYPVTEKRQWNMFINWTPIPTHYMISGSYLDTNRFSPCAENGEIMKRVLGSPEFSRKLEKYRDFTEYVSKNTLFATSDPYNLYLLFWNVRCIVGMGLPLPNWCSNECYRNLEDITGIVLEAMTYTAQLKRLSTGPMLNQFLENIVAENSKRKAYMFAAHDTTVSAFTRSLNLTTAPRVPDFGSAVIIEKLRGLMDNQIYIRLKMWTGVSEELHVMELNGCSEICPLTTFKKIVEPVMLTEEEKQCFLANKDYAEANNELLSDAENTGVHKYYALAGNDIMSLKYVQSSF